MAKRKKPDNPYRGPTRAQLRKAAKRVHSAWGQEVLVVFEEEMPDHWWQRWYGRIHLKFLSDKKRGHRGREWQTYSRWVDGVELPWRAWSRKRLVEKLNEAERQALGYEPDADGVTQG